MWKLLHVYSFVQLYTRNIFYISEQQPNRILTSLLMHFACILIDAMHLCNASTTDIGYPGYQLFNLHIQKGIKLGKETSMSFVYLLMHVFCNLNCLERLRFKKKHY